MLHLEPIKQSEIGQFRQMLDMYWQELMPHADVVNSPEHNQTYFQNRFKWDSHHHPPYWALVNDRPVGFVHFTIDPEKHAASIEDFYVVEQDRRKGYGKRMVEALYSLLDQWGVTAIELNVRRDNPQALSFWESVGFRTALYCMRQYRDSETGQWLIGALSSDFAE